ncbi:MAG: ROK family protein [Chloroflexi bacterium]|nr:ROK family protein [Chloroflexota bacterium]
MPQFRGYRTGDQTLVRELNRAILLSHLRRSAPQSRASLAALTGLNKATVSSLINELLEHKLVCELGLADSSGGRRATLLDLNPHAGCLIGVEMSVDYVNAVLTDFRAEVQWRERAVLGGAADQATTVARTIAMIETARRAAEERGAQVLGVGLGVPGLVDVASGRLVFGPNLGWYDVPIRDLLRERFSFPVFVDNDANASALGEWYFGSAQQVDNFVYLTANMGLGAGVMLGGQVHRGATRALVRRVATGWHDSGEAAAGGEINMECILQAAGAGDPVVLAALEETARYLGLGIANLLNTFNPSEVVLGGVLSTAADYLLPGIERAIAAHALRWPRQSARLCVSAFRFDACAMGGVALVLQHLVSHPDRIFLSGGRQPAD